jgi:hypothetical protein
MGGTPARPRLIPGLASSVIIPSLRSTYPGSAVAKSARTRMPARVAAPQGRRHTSNMVMRAQIQSLFGLQNRGAAAEMRDAGHHLLGQ